MRMADLSALSLAERNEAMRRYRIIEPHLESGCSLEDIASAASVTCRTLQRWVGHYRKHGLGGLARKSRSDHGGRRAVSEHIQKIIEGLALERPRLPLTTIYRKTTAYAELVHEAAPSYWMVRDIVGKLPSGVLTLAHEGQKVYSEVYDLVHRREASGPNAIWQADHSLLDIPLLREDGTVASPWLTIIIDDYSRAIAGYYLAFDPPSTLRTALTLRQAIWSKGDSNWAICGIPEVFYTDNGSDFASHRMEQVAVDLKMRLVFSLPGKPRGRGRIERFFRTVDELFLSSLDGYLERFRRNPTLTLNQLDSRFRRFLLEQYHRRPIGEASLSPMDRWAQGGFLPRMPESLEQLDLLLMHAVSSRKVRQDGIHFENLRYQSPVLAAYVGESVEIRYDPRDMGEIRVFYRHGFLCRAISPDLAGETISLKEIVQARNRRRKELRALIRDRKQVVDALLEIKQGFTPEVADVQPIEPQPTSRLKRYFHE